VLPANQPELCVLVLADEPLKRGAGSHFGGKACGPIFTNIAARAASILALRPSPPASTAQAATRPDESAGAPLEPDATASPATRDQIPGKGLPARLVVGSVPRTANTRRP